MRVTRPGSGLTVRQEESKEALREDNSAAVNLWTTIMAVPHFGHCQNIGPCIRFVFDRSGAGGTAEELTTNRKASWSPTVGEKAEVADANEAFRQDV